MRPRLGRGLIAAMLIGTLIVPAAGSLADQKKKVPTLRKELKGYQRKREVTETKASRLQQRVDDLNAELATLQMELNDLNDRLKVARADVKGAEERIAEAQEEIDEVQEPATDQAVALYKAGATEVLDVLLGSGSLAELDDKVEMLGIAAEESTTALIRYGRLQVRIRTLNADLFNRRDRLQQLHEQRSDRLADQSKLRGELNADLRQLNKKAGKLRNKENITARQIAKITGDLVAFQATQSVSSLGTSSSGYIWPLNGGVTSYYGPRWGRMHSGIDIDGYTGQPVIAAKGGRVALASYYSGYGYSVIIDHGGGYATMYAHLSSVATSKGALVSQGSLIGYVGCSGSCTGDHLHFEVRIGDRPVNPLSYLP